MKIERFEDIEAWKEARALVGMVYEFTKKAPFKNDCVRTNSQPNNHQLTNFSTSGSTEDEKKPKSKN